MRLQLTVCRYKNNIKGGKLWIWGGSVRTNLQPKQNRDANRLTSGLAFHEEH